MAEQACNSLKEFLGRVIALPVCAHLPRNQPPKQTAPANPWIKTHLSKGSPGNSVDQTCALCPTLFLPSLGNRKDLRSCPSVFYAGPGDLGPKNISDCAKVWFGDISSLGLDCSPSYCSLWNFPGSKRPFLQLQNPQEVQGIFLLCFGYIGQTEEETP